MSSDIKRKLTSRKFWFAVATFIAGILILCNVAESTAEKIASMIVSFGSIYVYLFAESWTDAKNTNSNALDRDEFVTWDDLIDMEIAQSILPIAFEDDETADEAEEVLE